tara:strand:- start:8991 stop:9125 length:135 start_codon:yes stop_codon:yes gene_type:complete
MNEKDEIDLLKIRVDQLEKLDQSTRSALKELTELMDALMRKLGI